MRSEKKARMISVEKRPKNSSRAPSLIASSVIQEADPRIKVILDRGLEVQNYGSSLSKGTLEELKVLREFIANTKNNYAFSLCDCCQKSYILGESIRGIHGTILSDEESDSGKVYSDVNHGKPKVLAYLDMCIETGKMNLSENNKSQLYPIRVPLPIMGLVKSTGKFESFPQDVVLWCAGLSTDVAEERVASLVKDKPSWLKTMVERLSLKAGSTVKDVKQYLDHTKPRFLKVQKFPSDREIAFWIRVTASLVAFGPPVINSLRQNLDVMVTRLGKRIATTRPGLKSAKVKSSSESDESSNNDKSKTPKKKGLSYRSALLAISKKNGSKRDQKVIDEPDPEKKMRMVFRKLGNADSSIPPEDWTAGIDESILTERIEAVKILSECFGVTLIKAVELLASLKASTPTRRKKGWIPPEIICVPGLRRKAHSRD